LHIQELQQWVRRLDSLIANKIQESNRLDEASDNVAINISTHVEFLDKQIKEIEEIISKHTKHIKGHKDLNDKSKLLNSIPGIGQKTIGVILAFLTLENFDSAKQVVAFVGLNPKPR